MRMYGLNLNIEIFKVVKVELHKCQSFKWFPFFIAFHDEFCILYFSTQGVN
jgi:hypothetical protein